jgi:hypothetical protein
MLAGVRMSPDFIKIVNVNHRYYPYPKIPAVKVKMGAI